MTRQAVAVLPVLIALTCSGACRLEAQVGGGPVRQESGPLSDYSTSVGHGGGPVHESGRNLRAGNAGRLSGNPVRSSTSGDLRSGPVSELSVGPVTAGRSVTSGAVTDLSAGAVQKDVDAPLRAMSAAPVQGLGALQERLRAIQPVPRTAPLPDDELEDQRLDAISAEAGVNAEAQDVGEPGEDLLQDVVAPPAGDEPGIRPAEEDNRAVVEAETEEAEEPASVEDQPVDDAEDSPLAPVMPEVTPEL